MRVGLLIDGEIMEEWMARPVERMEAETDATVTTVVENANPPGYRRYLEIARNDGIWTSMQAAKMLRRTIAPPGYRERRHVSEVIDMGDVAHYRCPPVKTDGFGTELPPGAVSVLADTDVAVRYGFGILVGDALTAPTNGVLSYHHGNLRRYRGRPAGFWEYLHDEGTAGVTLQRITDELDAGRIVVEDDVAIEDCTTWGDVLGRLYRASDPMLAEAVRRLDDPSFEPTSVEDLGSLYTRPDPTEFARFLTKSLCDRVGEIGRMATPQRSDARDE
ncbi:formyltransferase family protein (plasmid) [Haladaptatus sp. SPP-AMP-3]|uniref:formyltransferase family protein n=1 Tax=Haladaptatus sp. SPP-AMP-3 TaxID=3121295 RepID=UPI003C304514